MKDELEQCETTEKVITLLESRIGKARESADDAELQWCYGYLSTLRDISQSKLDDLTVGQKCENCACNYVKAYVDSKHHFFLFIYFYNSVFASI